MKIAIVHYAAAPIVGGVERVIDEHAALMSDEGHDVTLFCCRGGSTCRNRVVRLSSPYEPLLLEQFATFDLVIVHNVFTMPFCPELTEALWSIVRLRPEVRFAAWTHDVAAANPDLQPGPDFPNPLPQNIRFIAISELRKRQLREAHGVSNSCVIPNGIDVGKVLGLTPNVAALASRFQLFDGRTIFLHPTRILRRKNIEMSIRLTQELGNAVLLVTGAEDAHNPKSLEYAEMLRGIAGAETIFCADFFQVGDDDVAALYRLADALLFPSRQEGFGLPMLEGRIHRVPTIYSAIEPLNQLAGTFSFPVLPDSKCSTFAGQIGAWLNDQPAYVERRVVIRNYGWNRVYAKHIAPLLSGW